MVSGVEYNSSLHLHQQENETSEVKINFAAPPTDQWVIQPVCKGVARIKNL